MTSTCSGLGDRKVRFWLKYEPHEVKNCVALDFSLDQELTDLIGEYIEVHRPVLVRGSNERWLFPGQHRHFTAPQGLSSQICDIVEKRTGLRGDGSPVPARGRRDAADEISRQLSARCQSARAYRYPNGDGKLWPGDP